jgi:D-tyrosyl-tRNA(Tyr) deacylase
MRLVIKRVLSAKVTVEDKTVGEISQGVLVYLGIKKNDSASAIDYLINKLIHLRMFSDEKDRMNLSLLDKKYSCLLISQFTLYADLQSGRRPSFTAAEHPEKAKELYLQFIQKLKEHLPVQTGEFGAKMQVSSTNDGPVTFVLDSV